MSITRASLLTTEQRACLRDALADRLLAVCFGSGVDSTAMLVALHDADLRPAIVTFANTGGEKPESIAHLDTMNEVLRTWGWPTITVCTKQPLPTTGYHDLFSSCVKLETLPSLAFGGKSCSIKWKQIPQDQMIKGAKSGPNARPPHPVWIEAQRTGQRIVKLIGYDAGRADLRRSGRLLDKDCDFDFVYPLQLLGWKREDCVSAIANTLGAHRVPIKSACYYCPASKPWELYWLAAHHPGLLERALHMERVALTGRHSRFDQVQFGTSWQDLVRNADRFPSSKTTVGLGRSFAWNHWARVNNVVDEAFRVHRDPIARGRFLRQAVPQTNDNALDVRSTTARTRCAA